MCDFNIHVIRNKSPWQPEHINLITEIEINEILKGVQTFVLNCTTVLHSWISLLN